MSSESPIKLLVATEFPPNASGGGPAVVRQMLKNWPAKNLAWWSCFSDHERRFGRETAGHHVAMIPEKLIPHIRFSKIKSAMLETFWVPWATGHFRKTLETELPDAVWIIPHNWSILPVSRVLAGTMSPSSPFIAGRPGRASLPRFHVSMQDYPDAHHHAGRFGEKICRSMVAGAEWLYAAACTRDATSHPMIADLLDKTGKNAAQMLHAGLESQDFKFLKKKSANRSGPIRIAYAGTILVEEVFTLFIEALRRIRGEIAGPVELHLFGAHSYAGRDWFDAGWMHEHGNLPEEALLNELCRCEWGFSPMALTDEDPRYNRFSFPTKFITYLAAGLPVITLGHPESSVVKMARSYDVGLCSSSTNPEELAGQLRLALSDPAPWERFKGEIIRCAQTEFDAGKMRRKLYECLGGDAVPGVPD